MNFKAFMCVAAASFSPPPPLFIFLQHFFHKRELSLLNQKYEKNNFIVYQELQILNVYI